MRLTWRQRFAPTIRRVLDQMDGRPEPEIRQELRRVWSEELLMSERACWPYKVYRDEIRVQMGRKRRHGGTKVRGPLPLGGLAALWEEDR